MKAGIVERKVNTGLVGRVVSAAKSVLRRSESTLEKTPKEDVFSYSVVPPSLQGMFLRQVEIEKDIRAHKCTLRSIEIRFPHKNVEMLNGEMNKIHAYKAKLNHRERVFTSEIDFLSGSLADDHYFAEYLAYQESKPMKNDDDTASMFVPKSLRKKVAAVVNKALGLEKPQSNFEEKDFDSDRVRQSFERMQTIIQRKSYLQHSLDALRENHAPKRERVDKYHEKLKDKFGNAYSEWFKVKEQIFNLEEELRNLTGL